MSKWKFPADHKFAKSDEWIRVDGAEALIGVSDYAQDALSDVVFVDLPTVGAKIDAGKAFGTIESTKAASDLNMPVGGEVVAVNTSLEGAPEQVNSDPYGTWIIRIKPSNLGELDNLLDATAYEEYCNSRG